MKLFPFIRSVTRQFAEFSSVAGVGQIVRSIHWSESLFWLLALVGGIFLTINDCARPIMSYINEESLSTINVVSNDTLSFPGASLCIEIDSTQLLVKNVSHLTDADKLKSFGQCLMNLSCLNDSSFFALASDLIYSSIKLLSHYHALEGGRDEQIAATNASVSKVPSVFYDALVDAAISPVELVKALAYLACRQMDIRVKFWQKDRFSVVDFCSRAQLVWFGIPPKTADETDLLCYNVENLTIFHSMEERYELSFYPYNVLPRESEKIALFNHYAYLIVDGVPISTDLNAGYSWIPFDQCKRFRIDLMQRITLLSKASKPCASRVPFLECLGRCRIREIAEHCNCSAVSWALYITDEMDPRTLWGSCFDRYSPSEYDRCRVIVKEARLKNACSQRCLQKCETNIFRVESSICESQNDRPNATYVIYSLYRLSYSHVEEKPIYDVSTLVSSLGGIIGLWLGAGFIGLLDALLCVPKAVVQYVVRKGAGRVSSCEEQILELRSEIEQLKIQIEQLKIQQHKSPFMRDFC